MTDQNLSDKLKGTVNKAKGEIKDQLGNLADNTKLQVDGKADKIKGEVQEKAGEVKDILNKK